MLQQRRSILIGLLTWLLILINIKDVNTSQCPIGFKLKIVPDIESPNICYKLKQKESFVDKYVDCVGNMYSFSLLTKLNITRPNNLTFWSDYKNSYPGGPFIDYSYQYSTGDILTSTFDVEYSYATVGLEDDYCTVAKPGHKNLTAVDCNEEHYRYCIVGAYDTLSKCDENYWMFSTPTVTCLHALAGVGGASVRATRSQAVELCAKENATLLQRGWRNANHKNLIGDNREWIAPLGVYTRVHETSQGSSLKVFWEEDEALELTSDTSDNTVTLEEAKSIEYSSRSGDVVALKNQPTKDLWVLVNDSYVFLDVICEKPIVKGPVVFEVYFNNYGDLSLIVNDSSIEEKDIWCFTDSVIFYPSKVKVTRDQYNDFLLTPITDGYYWCINAGAKDPMISDTKKVLYVRDQAVVANLYSIKIRIGKNYSFESLDKLLKVWTRKLSEFVTLRTIYLKGNGNMTALENNPQEVLKRLKSETSKEEIDAFSYLKIKRVYLDRRTVLLHGQLNPEMLPLTPSLWEGIQILYMKPAYFCPATNNLPPLSIDRLHINGCSTFKCVGNFNEGVQWIESVSSHCRQTTVLETGFAVEREITHDIMPTVPTTTPWTTDSSEETQETTGYTTITTEFTTDTPDYTTDFTETPSVVDSLPTDETPPIETPPPELPPDEQVQNVLDHIQNLLQNPDEEVPITAVEGAFDMVDNILALEADVAIPGTLLHLLDELGTRIDLAGQNQSITVRSSIALVVAETDPELPVRGLRIATRDEDEFTSSSITVLEEDINDGHLLSEASEAVIQLPESVAYSDRRISFVVFRNDRAFNIDPTANNYNVNSRVISITVENTTHFEGGEVIDIHLLSMGDSIERNQSRSCGFYDFWNNETGGWSQVGCTFIRARREGVLNTCRCDHLTHFAEILIPRTVFSERNERALELISLIGCFISIVGLLLIGITAILFRPWRREFNNKIWIQLSLAIFLMAICFVTVVLADFEFYNVSCMLVGVALHYSVLSSFCWMLVAAIISYRRLVVVFSRDPSHKLLRASAFAWGTPCAIIGILLSVDPHSYADSFEDTSPNGAFCYPSGLALWLTVYTPIAIMLLANWILFAIILRSVFSSSQIQRHGDSKEALRCATVSCLLVFLFGLPWIFGLFANNIVFAYLFNLTTTFQGFVLFVFFILCNKKTRDLWLNKLKIKQSRKVPVTSSSYKSTGLKVSGGTSLAEASSSKPRSLASTDESRFS